MVEKPVPSRAERSGRRRFTAAEFAGAWERFWYRPESARNLAAARILLAATGLWVVLSRYDLPSLLVYPPALWSGVTAERRLRFLLLFDLTTERVLYVLLHLALLAALAGLVPRLACFASGLLLYHFAPLESLIISANPYLRGLTLPALGLLILSFARPGGPDRSWEYRWPLALVQVLFCEVYLFAGYSKLFTSGLGWLDPENLRGHLLLLNQAAGLDPRGSWGYLLASGPAASVILAWGGLLFELVFPAVLFSRTARWVLLPAAFLFHVTNAVLFRINFHNTALLLLFVNWDAWWPNRAAADA
jgi:hypothetical protein